MSEQTTLTALGLHTSENELGLAPQGGLVKAQNCSMLSPGVIASRRGFNDIGYALSDEGKTGWYFDDTLIAQTGASTLEYSSGSAFVPYAGTFTPPDAATLRMKALETEDALYPLTTKGAYRISTVEAEPLPAGGPRNFEILSAATNSTVGFLADGYRVSYRLVWGTKDTNGRIHYGVPSGRITVSNSAGAARNVTITFPVPTKAAATTEWFWQLYRTRQVTSTVTSGATSVSQDTGDECKLVYESYFTSAQIAAESVTFVDTSPDTFLGPPLYTNVQVDKNGILAGKYPPPYAKDAVWWQGRAWYANTKSYYRAFLQIIAVGFGDDGKTGIRVGDLFVLRRSTSVYEFAPAVTYAGTTEANIEAAARSLVALINADNSAPFRAQYLSGPSDAPGKIMVEALDLDSAQFFVTLRTPRNTAAIGTVARVASTVTVTLADSDDVLEAGDTIYLFDTDTSGDFPAGTKTIATAGAANFTYTEAGAATTNSDTLYWRRATAMPQWGVAPPPSPSVFGINTGGLVRTGGSTVTATCTTQHYLLPGMTVPIDGVNGVVDANFAAGTFVVTSIVDFMGSPLTSVAFTYTQAGTNVASTVAYQSGARVAADNDETPGGLMYSDPDEPEAVPLTNTHVPGKPSAAIERIKAIGNYLYALKEDGVWVVTGYSPDTFASDQVPGGSTVHTVAPDSVASVSEDVYALTDMGVALIRPSGVRVISDPIWLELVSYLGDDTLANTQVQAFATGSEIDSQYVLCLPELAAGDPPYDARRAYVYDAKADAWTTWEREFSWGVLRPSDGALVMGGIGADDDAVFVQRSRGTAEDYADDEITRTVVAWDSAALELEINTGGVSVGDVVTYGGVGAVVLAVVDGTTLTLSRSLAVAPSNSVTIYEAFQSVVEWRAFVSPSPADEKQWRELHLHFRRRDFRVGTLTLATDQSTEAYSDTVEVSPYRAVSGTISAVGPNLTAYSGLPTQPLKLRVPMPRQVQRGAYLSVKWTMDQALAMWWLNGLTLVYERGSEKSQF